MENGVITHQGPPTEILTKETLISQLSHDSKITDDDSDIESDFDEKTAAEGLEDGGLVSEEKKDEGAVKLHVYGSYWNSIGHCLAISILVSLLLMQGRL